MNQAEQTVDSSQRFLFDDTDIRGELVHLDSAYQQCVRRHDYPPAIRRLLGEFLAAAVLLASTIKYEGRLVLQARGEGEVTLVMAECSSEGEVRGIVRFEQAPQAEDFRSLLGKGVLAITVDSRKAEPYQGIVSLEGESLAECLAGYFAQSEQLLTRFFIAVNDERVSALLLQQLPPDVARGKAHRAAQWEHIATLAATVTAAEMLGLDNETLLYRLYHQEAVRVFAARALRYQCSCSRERTAGALLAIGREEVESILLEQGGVSMTCEFCGSHYQFSEAEVRLLLDARGNSLTH